MPSGHSRRETLVPSNKAIKRCTVFHVKTLLKEIKEDAGKWWWVCHRELEESILLLQRCRIKLQS